MKDQLVECNRCGGNACYEQHIDENTTTWLCMGCGFTTSTMMLEGSKLVAELLQTSPELYKDLLFKDQNNRVWAPSTITLPGKGMVFIDGNNKDNWNWTAVKAVEITEEDRKLKQYPSDQVYRMDMQNSKHFEQRDFMSALEVIGFYEIV
jgi:hypothetical protein